MLLLSTIFTELYLIKIFHVTNCKEIDHLINTALLILGLEQELAAPGSCVLVICKVIFHGLSII